MPSVAEAKVLFPGTAAPHSGIYEQIGPGGRTGAQISIARGDPLPRTLDPQNAWELIASTEGRQPPDMQVVTKGWWKLKEERASIERLEQEDLHERR